MKQRLLLIILLGISVSAYSLDINFTTNTFKGKEKNYVEFYMQVVGNTVHFKTIDSTKMQGGVEVTLLFKQGDKIINFDKYTLNSPTFDQFNLKTLNFIDVKRYPLDNGKYDLEIKVKDINKEDNVFSTSHKLAINYSKEALELSDIQLIDYYKSSTENNPSVKNGFYLEQHTSDFYDVFYKKINLYAEIYNSDKFFDDDFVIKYYVDKVGDNAGEPILMRYKKMSPKSVNAMILTLNIADLPTGDYHLHLEIRNRQNEFVKGRSILIKRANPYINIKMDDYKQTAFIGSFVENMQNKQLDYCLKAISMQIHQGFTRELNELVRSQDVMTKRRMLYTYWLTKDHNTPELTFYNYMKIVDEANRKFASTLGHGFQSDRGYVFLKYGEPNEILSESGDPNAPPYQVWRYNSLGNQQEVKFVFYDPDLAGNNYILLHSTKRGELNNPNWKRDLYKNNPQKSGNFIDNTEPLDQYGKTIDTNFSDDN
ncbi:MAG: GWxTD domain-containing protein [Saprospiraceae bacterium]